MRTAEQIARLCGVSPQAVREWCRKNGVAKGAKGNFLFDESTEERIFKHYGVELSQVAKANAQDGESLRKQNETLIDMLRDELNARNRQLEEKDKQIAALSKALDQQQQLSAMQEKRILFLEEKPPAEPPAEPKAERRKLTKEEESREYMRLCQLMPKNPGFWSDPKTIAEWEDAQDEALSQMEEWEKELLIKRGFKKGFRYLWSKN